jgi:hypothetical protein
VLEGSFGHGKKDWNKKGTIQGKKMPLSANQLLLIPVAVDQIKERLIPKGIWNCSISSDTLKKKRANRQRWNFRGGKTMDERRPWSLTPPIKQIRRGNLPSEDECRDRDPAAAPTAEDHAQSELQPLYDSFMRVIRR